jgi:hypothetical protein
MATTIKKKGDFYIVYGGTWSTIAVMSKKRANEIAKARRSVDARYKRLYGKKKLKRVV